MSVDKGRSTERRAELKVNVIKFAAFLSVSVLLILTLPEMTIDPWGLVSPRLLVLLVATVMVIQFLSYLSIELWRKEGLLLMGTLVGVVNSNVINGAMASITKQNPKLADHAAATVVCGNLAMLARNAIVASTLGLAAAVMVVVPILSMLIVGGLTVFFAVKKINEQVADQDFEVSNPFALRTALQFAAVVTGVTIAGFGIHQYFGDLGLYVSAFVSVYAAGGPIILSAIMLASTGQITPFAATMVIMIASISSASNDAIIQLLCGARPLAKSFLRLSAPMLVTGILVLAVEWLLFG